MSTPTTLAARGGPLVQYEYESSRSVPAGRRLYLTRELDDWLANTLLHEPPDDPDNISPLEQVDALMWQFCAGKPLAYDTDRKKLEPHGYHVWELKPPDVRIFGWFYRQKVFIAACGELKRNLSASNRLYKPFIDRTVAIRTNLGLTLPTHITGINANEVL